MTSFVCTVGAGKPRCDYKRNAKGTDLEMYGTVCAYELACVYKKEVK